VEKIEKIILPAQKLSAILKKTKAPTLPKDIGWSDEDFKTACDYARFTRDRFTFLDLV
jgi:glycerol dehydrogenase-like iron-containing ADH family enzyme